MHRINQVNQADFFRKNSIKPLSLSGSVSIDTKNIGVPTFKDTMANMIGEMNEVTNKPQELTKDMILGKADIQDVMTAMVQSELTVQTATTLTGKILQTYEKIMQIQI